MPIASFPASTHDSEFSGLPWREQLTVRRIMRVNHAGEHGAIRIYGAQIAIAHRRMPDITVSLEHLLGHEVEHRRRFREIMLSRQVTPCRMLWFWGLGGTVLGGVTALMGRNAVWTCTAAVEAAVHRHLEDQLHFLNARDRTLYGVIDAIKAEELSHLALAESNIAVQSRMERWTAGVIAAATHALIWLSTYGASSRLAADLKRDRNS